ncbi:MAG: ECF transporter S component [Clostridia bacterium]|nr:ECF transporter S component [Clostridia bacterium]
MKVKYLTRVAILAAIASILMYLEFPIPFLPPFLKIDLSDFPALVATFSLGPIAGIIVELIKNLVHLVASSSAFVGELANFIIGASFVGTAGLIYKFKKTKTNAAIAMTSGVIVMSVIAVFVNIYILIPLYARAFGMDINAIVAMSQSANKNIVDLKTLIILGITPFNIIKGTLISVITLLSYKKLSGYFHFKKSKEQS